MLLPDDIIQYIFKYINPLKYCFVNKKYNILYNTLIYKNSIKIQRWYRIYKLPLPPSNMAADNMNIIWNNKYYMIRFICLCYKKNHIINFPEFCQEKLMKIQYYAKDLNILNKLPQVDERKPSEVRSFLLNSSLNSKDLLYIGF